MNITKNFLTLYEQANYHNSLEKEKKKLTEKIEEELTEKIKKSVLNSINNHFDDNQNSYQEVPEQLNEIKQLKQLTDIELDKIDNLKKQHTNELKEKDIEYNTNILLLEKKYISVCEELKLKFEENLSDLKKHRDMENKIVIDEYNKLKKINNELIMTNNELERKNNLLISKLDLIDKLMIDIETNKTNTKLDNKKIIIDKLHKGKKT